MPVRGVDELEDVRLDQGAWLDLLCSGGDGEVRLPLLSGSMAPALLPGDLLTVRPSSGERCHAGDIVVLKDGKRLIAHRLIFVFRAGKRAMLVEKGDANPWPSRIRPGRIVGAVVAAEREGRKVFQQSPSARAEGRRIARGSALRFLLRDMPLNSFRRMIGREI